MLDLATIEPDTGYLAEPAPQPDPQAAAVRAMLRHADGHVDSAHRIAEREIRTAEAARAEADRLRVVVDTLTDRIVRAAGLVHGADAFDAGRMTVLLTELRGLLTATVEPAKPKTRRRVGGKLDGPVSP